MEPTGHGGGHGGNPGAGPGEGDPGTAGPGLHARPGLDWTVPAAVVFVLLGWIPVAFLDWLPGRGYFGPLEIPAILAMVGVLFAVIGVLRAVDLHDGRLRATSIAVGLVGLLRLFLVPLLA